MTATSDARGSSGTIDAGYDGLNRQLWRNTSNSPTGAYVTYGYDATASAGGVGRLTSETFANTNAGGSLSGSYAYTYDGRGQVSATTQTVGGTPSTTSATYNDAGQLLSQTYPNGDTLATSYDSRSGWQQQQSLTLSGQSTAVPLLTAEAYSGAVGARGLMTSATLGAFAALTSGAFGSYAASYDGLGRLTSARRQLHPQRRERDHALQRRPDLRRAGRRHRERHDDAAGDRYAGLLLRRPVAAHLGRLFRHARRAAAAPTPSDTGSRGARVGPRTAPATSPPRVTIACVYARASSARTRMSRTPRRF